MATKSKPVGGSSVGEDAPPPRESFYEKPLKTKKIEDKTGWKVRPENETIVNGKVDKSASGVLPEGFSGEKD